MLSKIFKAHPELVLIGLAVLLLAILVTSFAWGVTSLVVVLNKAIGSGDKSGAGSATFDLEGAAALDLKGLEP